jgi:hypothetical protein
MNLIVQYVHDQHINQIILVSFEIFENVYLCSQHFFAFIEKLMLNIVERENNCIQKAVYGKQTILYEVNYSNEVTIFSSN